jgi:anti-anti-sigma factor
MVISSSSPDLEPDRCQVCSSELKVEPPATPGESPCPRCGHLLWFTWENLGEVDVIKPTSERLNREDLDAFLDSVALRPGSHLVLDLGDVRFMASAALGHLISLKNRVGSVGGRFTIRNVDPDLMSVFRITRLDHVFDMRR